MEARDRPQRRRGIRASRVKLHKALADAGLKTQAALAERLVELEGLETAPTDVVSKVFREQPVDLQTLERIARALGVASFTLYLTADEAGLRTEQAPTTPEIPPVAAVSASSPGPPVTVESGGGSPTRGRRATGPLFVALAFSLVAVGAYRFHGPVWSTLRSVASTLPIPTLKHPRIVVAAFTDDREGRIATAVVAELSPHLRSTSAALQSTLSDASVSAIAQRMRADLVLTGEIIEVGQYTAVRAFLYHAASGARDQVWAEAYPTAAHASLANAVSHRLAVAILQAVGDAGTTPGRAHFPTARAQDEYLQGRLFMDRVHSELNMRRAQGHFEAAGREDPDFGAAYAALCVATLEAWWIADEQRQIEDAAKTCALAKRLDPDGVDTLRALAELSRKSGHASDAVGLANLAMTASPFDLDAALTLAAAEFDLFRQSGEPRWGQRSLEHAEAATRLSPKLAKPWQSLATYQFYVDSVGEAVPTFERAHELDTGNDYVTANLGTMYMCLGEIAKARDLYLLARNTAPASYTGDEFLGGVYYYLRDYPESARLRQIGADGAAAGGGGDIHQIYGALGDSWRHAAQTAKAVSAYRKALDIVERDFLSGNAVLGDKAHRAYYTVMLQSLVRRPMQAAVNDALKSDLDEVYQGSTDPSALLKVAQTRLQQGDPESARLALAKATARCPGLSQEPDVAQLAGAEQAARHVSLRGVSQH